MTNRSNMLSKPIRESKCDSTPCHNIIIVRRGARDYLVDCSIAVAFCI